MGIKFEQVIVGKAFGAKVVEAKSGKKYQTFTFSYGSQNQDGSWDNFYMKVKLFLSDFEVINEGEMLKVSGKFVPDNYESNGGLTRTKGVEFVAFSIVEREGVSEEKDEGFIDLSELSDDELDDMPF